MGYSYSREAVSHASSNPVPEGEYNVLITRAEDKNSQAGNPMVSVTYTIEDGEFRGRKLFDNLVQTEKALWKTARLCRALGFDMSEGLNFEAHDLLEHRLRVRASIEEGQDGVRRNVVQSYARAEE